MAISSVEWAHLHCVAEYLEVIWEWGSFLRLRLPVFISTAHDERMSSTMRKGREWRGRSCKGRLDTGRPSAASFYSSKCDLSLRVGVFSPSSLFSSPSSFSSSSLFLSSLPSFSFSLSLSRRPRHSSSPSPLPVTSSKSEEEIDILLHWLSSQEHLLLSQPSPSSSISPSPSLSFLYSNLLSQHGRNDCWKRCPKHTVIIVRVRDKIEREGRGEEGERGGTISLTLHIHFHSWWDG